VYFFCQVAWFRLKPCHIDTKCKACAREMLSQRCNSLPIPLVFCCSLIWLWFHDAQHPRTTYNFRWTLIVHHMSFPIGNYSTTHLIKTWHPADTPTMNGGVQRAAIALTSIANYSRASRGRGVGYATNKHHISSLARAILIGHSSILSGDNHRDQRCPRQQ
jgi:hypothetical protein